MGRRTTLKKVTQTVKALLYSRLFMEKHRLHERSFTRKRKITFPELITVILKGAKRGLHTAILEMIEDNNVNVESYSEAALCKARQKVNYTAFKELAELEAETFYASSKYLKYKKRYRVWAIDGSKVDLPTNPETLEEFGSEPFMHGENAQALASCLYDVLNHIILDAVLVRFDANERELAAAHIDRLAAYCLEHGLDPAHELLTMDRGYPSEELIRKLSEAGFKFVIRVNKDYFWREVRRVTSDDEVIERGSLTVRVVRVPLAQTQQTESGNIFTTATLITNLTEEEASLSEVAELYRLRWGIETNYAFLKSRIELENFTGISPLCIRQDFYAAVFYANMIACAEYDAAPKIKKINDERILDYKPNFTETYRAIRKNIFLLVLSDSPREFDRIVNLIQREILKTIIPVRLNRHPKRGKPNHGNSFHHNHKPS